MAGNDATDVIGQQAVQHREPAEQAAVEGRQAALEEKVAGPQRAGLLIVHREIGVGVRGRPGLQAQRPSARSEEHTSELQSLMRISYAVLCLTTKNHTVHHNTSGKYEPDVNK